MHKCGLKVIMYLALINLKKRKVIYRMNFKEDMNCQIHILYFNAHNNSFFDNGTVLYVSIFIFVL